MRAFLTVSRGIDRLLGWSAVIGGWCIVGLILVVFYDVVTRYLGVPKVFGLNSTKLQESEYWLHSYAIVLVVGAAYVRQTHVRIDLLRENLSLRLRYWIEAVGCAVMLVPYSILGAWLSWPYALRAWSTGETSKSQIGLSDIWLLKGGLIVMFVLLGLAGLSVFIKAVAGIAGQLPASMQAETLGGEN
ncbi:TRAP transporter small permease subunit [Oceaniglobus trochenteri]|uniref:TRAP transporter small permease subunit n=1 Tax=Oceaniglobus trochenteri TaxID=2763260 RepID=UPI001CFFEF30|nr:TRAP transporter small permease subunit [Oceaniglobus trochenteri]